MELEGIIVPLITPLTPEEDLDELGFRRLIRYVLAGGVQGLFALGSSGEFAHLTNNVKQEVMEIIVDEATGKAPILIGVGDCGTRRTIQNAKLVKQIGADFIVAPIPYYFPPTQAGILEYYTKLVEETQMPTIIYNIPQLTKVMIATETVEKLSQLPLIAGIKDSSGNMEYFQGLIIDAPEDFQVFQGDDSLIYASLLFGAAGAVVGSANVAPQLAVGVYNAVKQGDYQKAKSLQQKIISLLQDIYYACPDSPLGCLKTAAKLLGLCNNKLTSPLIYPNNQQEEQIQRKLKQLNLLK